MLAIPICQREALKSSLEIKWQKFSVGKNHVPKLLRSMVRNYLLYKARKEKEFCANFAVIPQNTKVIAKVYGGA